MPKIELEEGDILIRRVRNGWIAKSISEADPEYIVTDVYSKPGKLEIEEALCSLLYEQFAGYTQSKRRGGVSITLEEEGWENDEKTC
tara:strand:- start:224 stop:484 length:261 start_codon:yes stop_codon:yes gene_type:complete